MWWVNGRLADHISVADRGLAYGDGLFETIRVIQQSAPLIDAHMQRLDSGARRLGLRVSVSDVKDALEQSISYALEKGWQQSLVKLILTRSGASAGYRVDKKSAANILVRASEYASQGQLTNLNAKLCEYVLPTQPALAGIKHLNRLDQVLASQELDDEDEGLLLDSRGFLAEGISNNVFLVQGSEISTPALLDLGVKGVMRKFLLDQIPQMLPVQGKSSLSVQQRDISMADLKNADELLLANAVRGIRNVSSVKGIWRSSNTEVGDHLRSLLDEKLGFGFNSELVSH